MAVIAQNKGSNCPPNPFHAAVTSFGQYEIVNTFDLKIKPTFNVAHVVYPSLPRETFLNYLDEVSKFDPNSKFSNAFTDSLFGR